MPLQARPQGITFDEYGRPFIILKEQDKQKRLTGLDAQKVEAQNYAQIFVLTSFSDNEIPFFFFFVFSLTF